MPKRKHDGASCTCGKVFANRMRLSNHLRDTGHAPPKWFKKTEPKPKRDPETEPDWESECDICGASPVMPATGMCFPCTTGDASTIGGNL